VVTFQAQTISGVVKQKYADTQLEDKLDYFIHTPSWIPALV
jgi:hypothetical protein